MIHTVHSFHSEGLCPVAILEWQQGSNLCVHCVSCFTKYPCLCLYICCSVSSTPSTFLCSALNAVALFRIFQLFSYTPFFTKITVYMKKTTTCNWYIFYYINVISERRTNISNNPCCAHSEPKWSNCTFAHPHTDLKRVTHTKLIIWEDRSTVFLLRHLQRQAYKHQLISNSFH